MTDSMISESEWIDNADPNYIVKCYRCSEILGEIQYAEGRLEIVCAECSMADAVNLEDN